MASPYQEFVRKARERFEENKKKKLTARGGFQFTSHARYKMSQYGLSDQKVKGVIRNPKRTQKGIAPKTVAVMQPVSAKRIGGKETWKQEVWVMYVKDVKGQNSKAKSELNTSLNPPQLRIISAWRYPGISPKGNPIPDDIWQELNEGGILDQE